MMAVAGVNSGTHNPSVGDSPSRQFVASLGYNEQVLEHGSSSTSMHVPEDAHHLQLYRMHASDLQSYSVVNPAHSPAADTALAIIINRSTDNKKLRCLFFIN